MRSGSWPSLRVSFQASGRQGQQLRCGREIPEGGAHIPVTQIRREPRRERADVLAGAVPPDQGVHGKAVAVMRNSALAALCGRLGYVPCRDVSAGRGGGSRVAVRIILLGLGLAAQRVEQGGVAVSAAGCIDRAGEESPCSFRLRTGVIV